VDSPNWKLKNICVFSIKRICRRGRNLFALHSSNLSWAPYYISPRWIDTSLLTITSKHLTGCEALFEVPELQVHCGLHCLLNSWLSCKVGSCRVWSCYSTTIFKTRHRYQLQPEDDIRWLLETTGSLLRQTCETNSETRFSLKFLNVCMWRIC